MKIIDHIAIFENLMPKEICNDYINFFESFLENKEINYTNNISIEDDNILSNGNTQFNIGITGRSDIGIFLNAIDDTMTSICHQYLQIAYTNYSKEYPDLTTSSLISIEVKMQRTPPGGGYHVWHSEKMSGQGAICSRQVVWMIYLNDMPDGEGETEFFHQKLRIKPTAGTILLWPAGYTHLHRGNTVFTENKYILTGWFNSVYEN